MTSVGEFMIKRIIFAIIAIALIVVGSAMLASGQEITTDEFNIEITTNGDYMSVVESHSIDAESSETISFWIQEFPTELSILIDGINIDYYTTLPIGDNRYFCNISDLNVTTDTSIKVNYLLDLDTTEFEKTLQFDTTSLAITFDGTEIYTSANLKSGSSLTVALQKPTQGQTETVESIPIWIYAIIVILIILLVLSFIPRSKKQTTTKTKQIAGGSEELLSTKKALLMELLKDVEKKHRAKEISDDTYHKIKEQYKQEAVEAMKQLDDMKSKVK
jgi:ABC-type transport system involved in multi-copper enzyme maturation permease subunit